MVVVFDLGGGLGVGDESEVEVVVVVRGDGKRGGVKSVGEGGWRGGGWLREMKFGMEMGEEREWKWKGE